MGGEGGTHIYRGGRARLQGGAYSCRRGCAGLNARHARGKPSPILGCDRVDGVHPSQSITMNLYT
jgi:hypothetical protein